MILGGGQNDSDHAVVTVRPTVSAHNCNNVPVSAGSHAMGEPLLLEGQEGQHGSSCRGGGCR